MQMEDNKNYQKALDYIGKLEFAAVSFQSFLAILISEFGVFPLQCVSEKMSLGQNKQVAEKMSL